MIHGVEIKHLAMHVDSRGCFTEIFRNSWDLPIQPVLWSLVASRPRVLRGMHFHLRHDEFFLVARGHLYDLRWILHRGTRQHRASGNDGSVHSPFPPGFCMVGISTRRAYTFSRFRRATPTISTTITWGACGLTQI